jgi:archaellum biogenesis ATPase FlaH
VSKLILDLWSRQPGKFFCISTKDGADKWKDNFFSRDEFTDVRSFIKENSHKNIYFCPHGFNRRARQKSESVIPNLLYADLDFADPKDIRPRPTIAIQSSPGRFVGIWELKDPVVKDWESLNRRLTYHVGADPGGWDLTQVLRCPGTRNYKYASEPLVRPLWDDGKLFTVNRINSYLPIEKPEEEGEYLSAAEVFENYQEKLPRWVRRELLSKSAVGRADRSEMLWKLENACVEAGMTLDEAFAVIKNSVWNKFSGRRNEDQQLRRELSKIVEHHFKENPQGADKLHRRSDEEESRLEKEAKHRLNFKPMTEVERENLDFVWRPYLARGEVSILEGDPGLGKSYMAQMISAAVATGQRLPSSYKGQPKVQGPVIYFDIENSAGTVTKPRLEDNGFKDLPNYYVVEEGFSIDDEDALEEVYDKCEEIKPALVIFDTLNTYIGKADTYKAAEVTQAFNNFKDIAKQFNCAVLVLRHLTKGGGSAIYRGQGSIAFAGSARVVMSVGVDPGDTDVRAMAITKINFAKAPKALTFRIEERKKDRSEFIWGEYVDLSAQEIMDAAAEARAEGKQGDHMQEAMEFLESTITGAEVEVDKLYRMAEKRSISRKLIDRAFEKMDIIERKKSKVRTWTIQG